MASVFGAGILLVCARREMINVRPKGERFIDTTRLFYVDDYAGDQQFGF